MAKYCPNCGEEIKEKYKFCLSCGKDLKIETSDADKSPIKSSSESKDTSKSTHPQQAYQEKNVPPPQQPVSQQQYQQPQTYSSGGQKKIPMKIIGLLIGIVIIVVIVVVVFMTLGGASGPMVGEWQTSQSGYTMGLKLNGDHSIEMSMSGTPYVNIGNWEEKSGQLCLTISGGLGMDLPGGSQCYDYEITNNGQTMTWSVYGSPTLTWTKS